MTDSNDRRQFWRAHFHGAASLELDGSRHPCQVDDISLKGALLEIPAATRIAAGSQAKLFLELASGTSITMQVTLVHIEGQQIGVRCDSIDIDSLTHLRRMIELNAGDTQVFERDLSALLRDHRAASQR